MKSPFNTETEEAIHNMQSSLRFLISDINKLNDLWINIELVSRDIAMETGKIRQAYEAELNISPHLLPLPKKSIEEEVCDDNN